MGAGVLVEVDGTGVSVGVGLDVFVGIVVLVGASGVLVDCGSGVLIGCGIGVLVAVGESVLKIGAVGAERFSAGAVAVLIGCEKLVAVTTRVGEEVASIDWSAAIDEAVVAVGRGITADVGVETMIKLFALVGPVIGVSVATGGTLVGVNVGTNPTMTESVGSLVTTLDWYTSYPT